MISGTYTRNAIHKCSREIAISPTNCDRQNILSVIWAAWPYQMQRGSSRAIDTALPDSGIGVGGRHRITIVVAPPAGRRLQLRRRVHHMCAGRSPRCGRGAKGRNACRALSVRERLVLRHRLGSRRRLEIQAVPESRPSRRHRTTSLSNCAMTRQSLDEGANMLPSARPARRAITGAIGIGALAGAMLFGAAATAAADEPPPPVPPPCTAAELAGVMSGVTFDTSNYLFSHPDVNDFFTSLKGQARDEMSTEIAAYSDANPQVRDDLQRLPGSPPPTSVNAAARLVLTVRAMASRLRHDHRDAEADHHGGDQRRRGCATSAAWRTAPPGVEPRGRG